MFWGLNPKTIKPFYKAYQNKKELKNQEKDYYAWLNGLYIQSAIASCFGKNINYPDNPFSFKQQNNDSGEFGAWVIAFNSKFKKEMMNNGN